MELRRWLRLSRLGPSAAVLCCAVLSAGNCPAAEDLAREAAALKARYAADLGRLAAWCRQKNLTAEAKNNRRPGCTARPLQDRAARAAAGSRSAGHEYMARRRKVRRAIWPSGIAAC